MQRKGCTDADLLAILEKVLMAPVMEAHGGLDAVKEWSEVLSGGEKQRLNLSRVFYHRPQFAILDECTSAINVEAEQIIFENLIATGMALVTISHRHTLFKHHTQMLTFDGEGGYLIEPIQLDELDDLEGKKMKLMKNLRSVLKDLGEDWPRSIEEAVGNHP
jgi:ABC-type uncharacterized transport system fused permease/ATPase subunit